MEAISTHMPSKNFVGNILPRTSSSLSTTAKTGIFVMILFESIGITEAGGALYAACVAACSAVAYVLFPACVSECLPLLAVPGV